jgi:hypothetical protein
MINILTMEREYGCGGGEIARKIADRLGWKLWDELLTCEIARLSDCDQAEVRCLEERVDPLYYRMFKSILRGSFEGSQHVDRLRLLDADSVLRITRQVVESAAAEGNCVIVGRGSQHFLRDRPATLRIFLYASRQAKVRRLRSQGIAGSEAEHLVDTVDREHSAFVEKYFDIQWPNPPTYHAMFNTDLGEERVIQAILQLRESLLQPIG